LPIPRKSITGKQPPAEAHPQALPPNPTAKTSPLLKSVKAVRGGPGMTWVNLTRKEVEEKFNHYRQQQKATNPKSLWQRLISLFGKSRKGE